MNRNHISRLLYFIAYFFVIGINVLYLERMPIVMSIFRIGRYAVFFVILFLFLKDRFRIGLLHVLLVIYGAILLYSSIENEIDNIRPLFSHIVNVATIVMLMDIQFRREGVEKMLSVICSTLFLFISLNFFFVLLYPSGIWIEYNDIGGMSERHLLGGNRNQMGHTLLLATMAAAMGNEMEGKYQLRFWLLLGISIATIVFTGSMTSLVGLSLFSLFILIRGEKLRSWYLWGIFFVYLFYQKVAVFSLGNVGVNDFARYFIEDVLKKDLTFTGRDVIWENAMYTIAQRPMWGWGDNDKDWLRLYIKGISTHNFILNVLIRGGFVALGAVLVIFISAVVRFFKHKCKVVQYALCTFLLLLFQQVTETYNFLIMVVVLWMMFNANYFHDTPNVAT